MTKLTVMVAPSADDHPDSQTVKIYVGGLPYATSEEELRQEALKFAGQAKVTIIRDRMTGRSRGFGFVEVPDVSAAVRFIESFKELDGRRLTVNIAKPMPMGALKTGRWQDDASLLKPLADIVVPPAVIQLGGLVSADLIAHFALHPEEMREMPHRKFEELVAEIFSRFGYDVELTKQTRDGGTDIIAIRNAEVRTRFLIQCKRLKAGNKVSVEPVRELLGVKHDLGASKGIIATTVYFTADAQTLIDRHRWDLEGKDYDGVVDWLQLARK